MGKEDSVAFIEYKKLRAYKQLVTKAKLKPRMLWNSANLVNYGILGWKKVLVNGTYIKSRDGLLGDK